MSDESEDEDHEQPREKAASSEFDRDSDDEDEEDKKRHKNSLLVDTEFAKSMTNQIKLLPLPLILQVYVNKNRGLDLLED